ncbi:MAG TPA: PSP1 C-terminal domain-containing protein [Planctomycetaceae bacterium]|nr:PSP1 C-terminal domain-containing protein [Planctomycetaceae bacterium]
MNAIVLVRYGTIPEVGRFEYSLPELPERSQPVIVRTHRGTELGTLLEVVRGQVNVTSSANGSTAEEPTLSSILRLATDEDRARHELLRGEAQAAFSAWEDRIRAWGLELELIDIEWTLEREKLVLYVLTGRGPDTTKLALQAAALGLSAIEVQPVDADGLVALPPAGGGCGSGGCGCHE